MARKRKTQPTTTTITIIGFLAGGEKVALESVGPEMWLTIGGDQIARRGRVGNKRAKTWIPIMRGWTVADTDHPLELEIKRNGVKVDWTARTQKKG
jgi:hypothetical protein